MWPKSAGSGRNHIWFVKIDSLNVLDVFCTKNRYFIVDNDEITCFWKPPTKMFIEKIHIFNEKTVQIEQSQYALKFDTDTRICANMFFWAQKTHFRTKIMIPADSGRFIEFWKIYIFRDFHDFRQMKCGRDRPEVAGITYNLL